MLLKEGMQIVRTEAPFPGNIFEYGISEEGEQPLKVVKIDPLIEGGRNIKSIVLETRSGRHVYGNTKLINKKYFHQHSDEAVGI